MSNLDFLDNPKEINAEELNAYQLDIESEKEELLKSIRTKLEKTEAKLHKTKTANKQIMFQNEELSSKMDSFLSKIEFLQQENEIKEMNLVDSKKLLSKYKQSNQNLQKLVSGKVKEQHLVSENYFNSLVSIFKSARNSSVESLKKKQEDELKVLWGVIVDLKSELIESGKGMKSKLYKEQAEEKYNFIDDLLNLTTDFT